MKSKSDTVKVSVNVPRKLLDAIDDYCCKVGITRTCAFSLFLYRGASFEQEVLQVLGNKKKLKRLDSICNEEYLASIEDSLMRAGNMVSKNSFKDIYSLSGLSWYADSLKRASQDLYEQLESLENRAKSDS